MAIERLGTVRFWCPETQNGVFGVSARYVVAYGHASVFVWDAVTGALLHTVDCGLWTPPDRGRVRGRLADDGTHVHVMRRNGVPCAIDLASGAVTDAPLPAGASVVTFWDQPRVVVRAADGGSERTVELDAPAATAAVTPDGRRVVVALLGYERRRAEVRDVASGRCIAAWTDVETGYVAISRDGERIVTAGLAERIRLHDVATGATLFPDDPHVGLSGLAFSRDGARVAGVSGYRGGWLWERARPEHPTRVPVNRHVAFATDGDLLGAGRDGELCRWSPAGELRARVEIQGRVTSMTALTGDRVVVTSTMYAGLGMSPVRDAVVADLRAGRVVARLPVGDDGDFPSVTATPDGRWLAVMHMDHVALHALDAASTTLGPALARWPGARDASFAGDGRLAVSTDDATQVIDVATRAVLATPRAASLEFVGHGALALEAREGALVVRDGRTFDVRAEFEIPRNAGPFALAPDGAAVAYCDGPTTAIVALPRR